MISKTASFCSIALLALLGLAGTAAAQAAPEPPHAGAAPPPDLRESVGKRLSAALGLPVRIAALRYELLTSRFVGGGVEAGPRRSPLLQLSDIEVKLSFSGQGGAQVDHVLARGVTLRLPQGSSPDQLLRWPRRSVELRLGEVREGAVLLGEQLALQGVKLSLEQVSLQVDQRGRLSAISGRFSLAADKLVSSGRLLGRLELAGTLKGKKILLEKASLAGPYGTLQLSGQIGLGGKLLGPWRLAGKAKLRPEPGIEISGGVKLRGATVSKLTARLALRASGSLPAWVQLEGLPPLKVSGSINKKQLRGTLRDLRMR